MNCHERWSRRLRNNLWSLETWKAGKQDARYFGSDMKKTFDCFQSPFLTKKSHPQGSLFCESCLQFLLDFLSPQIWKYGDGENQVLRAITPLSTVTIPPSQSWCYNCVFCINRNLFLSNTPVTMLLIWSLSFLFHFCTPYLSPRDSYSHFLIIPIT